MHGQEHKLFKDYIQYQEHSKWLNNYLINIILNYHLIKRFVNSTIYNN